MSDLFFITSHGWSGSSCLANMLNNHAEFFYSHLMHDRLLGADDSEEKFEKDNYFDVTRKESANRLSTPIDEIPTNLASLRQNPTKVLSVFTC